MKKVRYYCGVKNLFKIGDTKTFVHTVREEDTATFESGQVHPVYSTFSITRDAEWSSRLFVLEMKDDTEEGIGSFVEIQHHAPAFVGEEAVFTAQIYELEGNSINCSITVKVGERLVAEGRTGQKVLLKAKLERYFERMRTIK